MWLAFFVCCVFSLGFGATASAASDSFIGTNGIALTAHDSNWTAASGSTAISNITINNNHLHYSASYQTTALYYASSSADTSQVTVVSSSTGLNSTPPAKIGASVRASGSTQGYTGYLDLNSGGNWTYICADKGGVPMGSCNSAGVSLGSSHTVKVTASGTSTVTINVYVDGILKLTKTDSSSPLDAGSPGVFVSSSSGGGGDAFSDWSDLVINGVCGSNNGQTLGSLASGDADNCSAGAVTGFAGTGPWSWYCAGSGGGSDSGTCNASISNQHTLTYTAGSHGSITGSSSQSVNDGASGSAVTPVPDSGYHFTKWSDNSTANPRTDSNVSANISVTANFEPNVTVYVDPTCDSSGDGTTTTCGTHGPFKTWAEVSWYAGNTYSQKGGTTAYAPTATGSIIVGASGTSDNVITINSYGTGNAIVSGNIPISSGSWTGPDANGVYSQPKFNSIILEDGIFLQNSFCSTTGCGSGSNPSATNPPAGQFSEQWGQATEYYHPSSGTPADHVVEKIAKAGIELGLHDYVTIRGFSFTKAYYGIRSIPTSTGAASHITIDGNNFSYMPFGIWLAYYNATSTDNSVTNNTFDQCFSSIEIYGANNALPGGNNNVTVANNTITNGAMLNSPNFPYDWDYVDMDGWDKEGIGFQDTSNSNVYNNTVSGHVRGIEVYVNPNHTGNNNNYYNNYVISSRAPVFLQPAVDSASFYNNNIYKNILINVNATTIGGYADPMPGWSSTPGTASAADQGYGIIIGSINNPGPNYNAAYNNTIYAGVSSGISFGQYSIIKNNIIYGGSNVYMVGTATNVDVDHNLYYLGQWSSWILDGSQISWATWKSHGLDANSLNVDPKFTNGNGAIPASTPWTLSYPTPFSFIPSDFTLQSSSPAIDKGTGDVGLTTDYAGKPIVGNPDIGAYEYHEPDTAPPASPSGLVVQ